MSRARFAFEVVPPPRDVGVFVGNVRAVAVYDARDDPHRDYLGSLSMSSDQHAALLAELAGAAAARALHAPCHDPDDLGPPDENCRTETEWGTHRARRNTSREWRLARCVEDGKPWPCPTVEVLPS